MAEQWFEDKDLDALVTMIAADHAQVPTWRRQAAAYRELAELAESHHAKITAHIQRAMDHWSSRATSIVRHEASGIAESFQRGLLTATGNAKSLEAIADEIEAAKADLDEIQAEWAEMKAAYQKNPHLFDNYAIDGVTGFQAAKASYDRAARERMHVMSVETTQAWHTGMHEPGPYTGPTYGNVPRIPVTPTTGSGSGGGQDTTYPFTYHPPPTPPPSQAAADLPLVSAPPPKPDGPALEFPATTPGPGPSVITSPAQAPPPGPALPSGGFPGGTPPVSPGLFGPQRPGFGPSGSVPGQRPGAMPPAGPRTSPSVLGQRPTQPGTRNPARPTVAAPDRGVIRNPRQSRPSEKDEPAPPKYSDAPVTDELFEGLALNAGPDVVRPEPEPPRVRRRDVGPLLRRVRRK